jgi:hypothetical protein
MVPSQRTASHKRGRENNPGLVFETPKNGVQLETPVRRADNLLQLSQSRTLAAKAKATWRHISKTQQPYI